MRRPRHFLPLVFLLFLSLPSRAGAQGPDAVPESPTVTFEEAVRIALSNGRDVRLAAQDVRITAEGKNVASARWYPRVDARGDYSVVSAAPATLIQGTAVQIADKDIGHLGLTVEQTIYDFGRTRSQVDQAGARTDVAERMETVTRERQVLEVISAFLDAKRTDALRKVAEESLATAVDHRRLARDKFDVGTVAPNDVLAADVQVANAESALITAEVRTDISRSRLALRMGYRGDRSLIPATGPYPVPTGVVPPLSESLRTAFEKRSELRAQGASIREGEAAADTVRTEFAPRFFGQGGYLYESNDLNPNKNVFSILLGGKMNLFTGFADEASLRQARLVVDRRKEVLDKLRDEIALEVKSAHLLVIEGETRNVVAEVAVVNAEENLRIQNERYKEGMAISTEALDAQTLLTRAKVDRQNTVYDLAEARYRLLAARGELLDFLAPLITAGR